MRRILAAAALLVALPLPAKATTLNFEDSGLADNTAITNQFADDYGVTFGIDANLDRIADEGLTPFLEAVGTADPGPQGFAAPTSSSHTSDDEAPAFDGMLGGFFLRAGGINAEDAFTPNLLITYSQRVTAASGQIWDIDGASGQGNEQWMVEAFNAAGELIASVESPLGTNQDPGSLDSSPWTWSLTGDIAQIRFRFTGTKAPQNIGLAFDNFSVDTAAPTAEVPEPATVSLLAAGALAGLARRRRVRK